MGLLGRFRGSPASPDWASLMSRDEYDAFIRTLRTELDRRGRPYRLGDGLVEFESGAGPFGLSNLAQLCHATDRATWPETIATHLVNVEAIESRAADPTVPPFEDVRSILRVRLLPDESMDGMRPEDIAGSRRYAPGILLALMYDYPDSTRSVPPAHVEQWPLETDEIWQIATDNVRLEPEPSGQTISIEGSSFELAVGDDFYVASRSLRLADMLPAG